MNGSESSRWVAVSALAAAMFAVGFSFAGVACNSPREVSVAEATRAADRASEAAPAASSVASTKTANVAPSASTSAAALGASALVGTGTTRSEIEAASGGLKLKRIVVTHKIENREPVSEGEFALGSGPVYAFVEFENSAHEARSVRVMFQNQDTKATVGHVKLSVPAASERFRTWGNTRMIRDPGHWVAVVSTVEGLELGRAPFEVKG